MSNPGNNPFNNNTTGGVPNFFSNKDGQSKSTFFGPTTNTTGNNKPPTNALNFGTNPTPAPNSKFSSHRFDRST